MIGVIMWILVIGAILTFLTRPKGVQIKPHAETQSKWMCKDCNEIFYSRSRDTNCPNCGSNNVWPQ